MVLQWGGTKLYRFVTMPPRTQYTGLITSGAQLVATYRAGNHIDVNLITTRIRGHVFRSRRKNSDSRITTRNIYLRS